MLIVFHSLTGGTRQMAEAAARGAAAQAGAQVLLLEASKAGAADVLQAEVTYSPRRKTSRRWPG
jgi:flavodoxin